MMLPINRRHWLGTAGWGVVGASTSGWFPLLADELVRDQQRRRHCILLWMPGGPSQTDTFDMKPRHENGGEFREAATSIPGVRFSEHLPRLAKQAEHLAIIRGLSTKEGDHGRGTYVMRTGEKPMGPVSYPAFGAALSKVMPSEGDELPNYVSIGPYRAFNREAYGPGFLGPKYAPLVVAAADTGAPVERDAEGYAQLRVEALAPPEGVDADRMDRRLAIWNQLQSNFLDSHADSESARAHDMIYRRTVRMMSPAAAQAFDLSSEDSKLRAAYGKGLFGQGCLLARRLIERGVSFVEVSLGSAAAGGFGWDTHNDNFQALRALSAELDAGWSTLLTDLQLCGLLDQTTILWMGEFGRTPKINAQAGRDHFPQAWSCVLAGGGIAGGQVHGQTSNDGMQVESGKVNEKDVLATLCHALGVSPATDNDTDRGRPIPLVDGGQPIKELLLS